MDYGWKYLSEKINVKLILTDGSVKEANLPTESPVKRIVISIVDKLNLPPRDADGRPVSYALYDKVQKIRLNPDENLKSQKVIDGTEIRIEATIIPG